MMELGITTRGILTLKGTPDKKYEYLVRSGVDVIPINRKPDCERAKSYWESEYPVKDGYYIYVNTDKEGIDIETVLDGDPDPDPFETELFTIHNLRNCLLNYEKKIIGNGLCNCASGSGIVCGSSEDKQMADFLLSTVFVIEHLVCHEDYMTAAEIVEKIHGCNGMCQQNVSETKKCNCC